MGTKNNTPPTEGVSVEDDGVMGLLSRTRGQNVTEIGQLLGQESDCFLEAMRIRLEQRWQK